jgi:hypothetical protein
MGRFEFTKKAVEALTSPTTGRVYHHDIGQDNPAVCVTANGSESLTATDRYFPDGPRQDTSATPIPTGDEYANGPGWTMYGSMISVGRSGAGWPRRARASR